MVAYLRIVACFMTVIAVVTSVLGGEWEEQFQAVKRGQSEQIQLSQPISVDQAKSLCEVSHNLRVLLLDEGVLSDKSVKDLTCLAKLEHLRIRKSVLSDRSIQIFADAKLIELRILNLPQSNITGSGIRFMGAFPSLVQLRLGGNQLDDAAVLEIARLPALRALHLIGPKLTSTALNALAKAPQLTSFYLDDCDLPDSAWIKLFEAKPKLHVHIDQHHHDRDPNAEEH